MRTFKSVKCQNYLKFKNTNKSDKPVIIIITKYKNI